MNQIRIIGIGWEADDLTLRAVRYLKAGDQILLRTGRCGCAEWLTGEGIPFETMDKFYEQCEDFDELIEETAQSVILAAQDGPVVYCVSDLTDKTCLRVTQLAGEQVELIPGVPEGAALTAFSGDSMSIVSASDADSFRPDAHMSVLVREIDSPMLAGEIKLRLMEAYPEELNIYVSGADGKIHTIPLCELDWMDEASYDHRLCALIPSVGDLKLLSRYDARHLEEIMHRLRDWDGCPWDREQTHESLKKYLIEEAYEAVDAINRDNTDDLYDELGDILLQIIFHSDIARQFGEFEFSDVTTAICKKMIRRHAHIFGDAQADTPEDVNALWEQIKNQEKEIKTTENALRSVAVSLPALIRAAKVYKKARERGAEQIDVETAWNEHQQKNTRESLGQFLFALAGESGKAGLDPEMALAEETDRYISRLAEQESEKRNA